MLGHTCQLVQSPIAEFGTRYKPALIPANAFFVCELIFSLPFSISLVEQTFSKLKIVKTKRRTSLYTSTLSDLLELSVEGPSLSSFTPDATVDLWWMECSTMQRVNQNPRKAY